MNHRTQRILALLICVAAGLAAAASSGALVAGYVQGIRHAPADKQQLDRLERILGNRMKMTQELSEPTGSP